MKKKILSIGIIVVLLFVVILSVILMKNKDDELSDANGQDYFNAEVLAVYDDYVEVKCLDVTTGAITEGTQLSVTKNVQSENGVPTMKEGDIIRIVFSGVMETDPPKLQTVWSIWAMDAEGNIVPSK